MICRLVDDQSWSGLLHNLRNIAIAMSLYSQLLASANGFRLLSETGFLAAELASWSSSRSSKSGALCYVTLVEEMLSDGFSRHQKSEERVYGGRR